MYSINTAQAAPAVRNIFEDLNVLTVENKTQQLRFKTPKYFHVRGEHKNVIYSSSHGTLMRLKSEFV